MSPTTVCALVIVFGIYILFVGVKRPYNTVNDAAVTGADPATSTHSTTAAPNQGWGSWAFSRTKSAVTAGAAAADAAAEYTGVKQKASALADSVSDSAVATAAYVGRSASQAAGGLLDYTAAIAKSGVDLIVDQSAVFGPTIQGHIREGIEMGVNFVTNYAKKLDWTTIQSSIANNDRVKQFIASNQINSAYDLAMNPAFQAIVLMTVPAPLAAFITLARCPVGKYLYDSGVVSFVWKQLKPGEDQAGGSSQLEWSNLASKLANDENVKKFLKEKKIGSAEELAKNEEFQNLVISFAPAPIRAVLTVVKGQLAATLYHSGLVGFVWNKVNGKEATIDFTVLAKTLAADPAVKNYIKENKLNSPEDLMKSQAFQNILFAAAPAPARAVLSLANSQIGQYLYDNGALTEIMNNVLTQSSAGDQTKSKIPNKS